MTTLDYWMIIGFSVLVVGAGLALSEKKGTMKSFFAAGGAVPWWLSGLSLFMSFFSAGTFVVWGSIAYEYGFVSIMIQWGMCLAGFLIGFFIAPKWRKTGVLTAGEYIRKRFGKRVQALYVYLFLLLAIAYTGAFLYPVARLVNVSTGFSLEYAIIIIGLMIILYTAAGGLWAVIVTDVLQFVILTAAVIIVVPLALDLVGGVSGLLDQAPDNYFEPFAGEYTPWFLLAFAFYNMVFIGGNWSYVQRYTSVDSPKSARKVGYLFGILYLFSPVFWMIPPMVLRIMGGTLSGLENEGAYFLMCQKVLPAGMLGLMLAGMIFATASAVNTTLNMSAAVFTNDIFRKIYPHATDRILMRVARASTVVLGLITIVTALLVPGAGGIVEVVLSVGALTGVPLYGPPIWALFSKRQTAFSIYFVTLASLAVNLFFKFLSPSVLRFGLDRTQEMVLGVLLPVGLLALFEVIYAWKKPQSMVVQALPVDSPATESAAVENRQSALQNKRALRVIAYALLLTGVTMLGLGVMATTGRTIMISIALLLLAFVGYLFVIAKPYTD
ncbi:sodium:solute symporter family protein [Parapedobacter tibetensis]|uniref:sodium:solute symporter family protein n=1 Tax=Parapedobacter tibetensis TaxID=2972951 RepID=UPI00214D5409|nr:sodium:solute symporter family protein [Parapedobacter tibetensis]